MKLDFVSTLQFLLLLVLMKQWVSKNSNKAQSIAPACRCCRFRKVFQRLAKIQQQRYKINQMREKLAARRFPFFFSTMFLICAISNQNVEILTPTGTLIYKEDLDKFEKSVGVFGQSIQDKSPSNLGGYRKDIAIMTTISAETF